jgi:hypothetical protein
MNEAANVEEESVQRKKHPGRRDLPTARTTGTTIPVIWIVDYPD